LKLPELIQGGMGVGVSHWRLAKEVSRAGQLGVVAGTAVSTLLVRRLQQGDPGGHMRRALSAFPHRPTAQEILDGYFIEGGKTEDQPYRLSALPSLKPSLESQRLNVAAGFVEVFLAKEGVEGIVGINLLEKLQMSNLGVLYGAMLAGVDYVLMGAGIPKEIPGVLDSLSRGESVSLKVASSAALSVTFDPKEVFSQGIAAGLKRPKFLAIVSSVVLAQHLQSKATGIVDGFVVEGPTAGGHNAPPRGPLRLSDKGEPIYGPKDEFDFEQMNLMESPYWMAGGYGSPEKLSEAKRRGAVGIQVGTPFAFCEESGLSSALKARALKQIWADESLHVFTDPLASPTGFPFKVLPMAGTLSDDEIYGDRPRRCDLGFLRQVKTWEDGRVAYTCPAEPISHFVKKGGKDEECSGRKCLCNALLANVGLGQHQSDGYDEVPLLTSGDDLSSIRHFLKEGGLTYGAKQVVSYLIGS